MDDLSRPSRAQDEHRNVEEEEEEEEEVASINRDTAESRTNDGISRTALPRDNVIVNGTCNNIGEPAAGRADRVADMEQTEDHQRLNSQFRELRGVPPPIPGTSNASTGNTGAGAGAGTGAAAGQLPVAEQTSYYGETSGWGGGLASATAMEEEDEEEANLLDRATLRILWLQREQRILAEQNGQLQRLLDDRMRQQHEREPDNDHDEA